MCRYAIPFPPVMTLSDPNDILTPDAVDRALLAAADPAYKAFGDALQPGITDRIGVRMPVVRRLARDVVRGDVARYLDEALKRPCASQEALMVLEIVVGAAKGLAPSERLAYADRLLPQLNGWATCDLMGSALKLFREDLAGYLPYVEAKLADENPWIVRTAEVWLLEHYRTPEGLPLALAALDASSSRALPLAASGDYYLSMALAWCLSMLAVVDMEAVNDRIAAWRQTARLDDATLARTVRKIRESRQFTPEVKDAVGARWMPNRRSSAR